ncbi:acyl-CoA-binding domain-containing protein 4 isoform X8 [Physeter macrocephalus]|uniref:Acyl-CoA-binding domain-containing protein 4 isoform X8 n=1 Tax=Physeter macrocephalus TaxID=9755 RepID=A0A455BZK2_PHYMC|nr:acyl-CoA-binding domain-containing protein 4 isoform X8 [Physeter catodon]|eukprot:XP_028354484.1 acyl-CoA-binding domain-containing protein 4 isoform X8 [Physeter catodon]
MKVQSRTARNSSRPQSASFRTCLRTALTAPPIKRCCDSTATTSRLPWGPAWSPSLGSGTLLDVINGDRHGAPGRGGRGHVWLLRAPVPGWKEQVLNGDAEPAPEPPCLPKEPAPPSPEPQPHRGQDSEVFCDSMEQLEPELQVCAEQRGTLGGELNTRNSTKSPAEKGRLEGTLRGPQELDTWLVGTVRALQESMRDVQGRLQSLESMPVPRKQRPPPSAGPWPLRLSAPTLLFFLLWPFIVQWLFRQFRTQKR